MVRFPYNRYYVPGRSPWPFLLALNLSGLCITLVLWLHRVISPLLFVLPFMGLLGCV